MIGRMINIRAHITDIRHALSRAKNLGRDTAATIARLDDENTALRRELARAKDERRALSNDLVALSLGKPVKTASGAAVERLIGNLVSAKVVAPCPSPETHVPCVYRTGKHRWTYGERDTSGRRYLGPCPQCGSRTVDHGGPWKCTNGPGAAGSCRFAMKPMNYPHPSWWNGDIFIQLDGTGPTGETWLAARTGFINIQESNCGFGSSPADAVNALYVAEASAPSQFLPTTDIS